MAAPRPPPPRGKSQDAEPPPGRGLRAQHRRLQRDLAQALAGEEVTLLELLRRRPEGRGLLRLRDPGRARALLCRRLWGQRRRLDALGPPPAPGRAPPDPPPRPPATPPATDQVGRLRGGLGRLRLRVEEAERLTGLYRCLGAHLQEEAGTARSRLELLEAELGRRRRQLQDLRASGPRPGGHRRGPGREREVGARRAQGARPRALEQERGLEPPEPPAPPPESPEPEEGPEGAPPSPPPPPPPQAPAEPPSCLRVSPPASASPQRAARRAVGQELAALARGNALALGRLRAEAAALGERLQHLRYGGEGRRAGARRRAEELRQQLGQEQRRREDARRDLAGVTRALVTASTGVQHLAGRLRHVALEAVGQEAQVTMGQEAVGGCVCASVSPAGGRGGAAATPPGGPPGAAPAAGADPGPAGSAAGGAAGAPPGPAPPRQRPTPAGGPAAAQPPQHRGLPGPAPQLRRGGAAGGGAAGPQVLLAAAARPDVLLGERGPPRPPALPPPVPPRAGAVAGLRAVGRPHAQEPLALLVLPAPRRRHPLHPPGAAGAAAPPRTPPAPPHPLHRPMLLGPPENVSVGPGGARGQLCVRWQPPPSPYLESSLAYELALHAPGLPPRTVGVGAGRREQRVGALRGSTHYSVRARARPDGLSYSGYWSPWSQPATAVTPPDVDPVTLGLSCLLALLLLGLGLLGLLGHRRLLQEKLWPPVPGPEREFEGLFSAYGGNFQLWLCQGVGAPWAPPGAGTDMEELPSTVEEVGPPPGKGPPPEEPPPAAAPPAGPSPASSFEYTLFDPGSALLCPRAPPRHPSTPRDPPDSPPPHGPYANVAPQKGAPPDVPKWAAPPDGSTPGDGDTPGLGPPALSPPYVLCS
ncbi:erythropoietin receptor isoform X1 [Buteo buteo]|uniref:erythropoietin receptor isoform X1 n=1 Tax=Buteo buteo TaxID=30397 RepID=UPI003EB7791E